MITLFLNDSAYAFYCKELGGEHPENDTTLHFKPHKYYAQQPKGSVLCGYYVCEWCRVTYYYKVNREDVSRYRFLYSTLYSTIVILS